MSASPPERVLSLLLFPGANRAGSPAATKSSPASRPAEDHELMTRLQEGESSALETLFDRYSRLVFGIALRTLRDYSEAEDAVQDTFLYLFRRAVLFDPQKGSAKAWIIQMAVHRALDRRLRLSRSGFYLGTKIDPADDTLSGSTDLEREIGTKLVRAQLERAFAELPETQRRTLEMFYFEGLELREIAEKLNAPLGNVRHHYYRGLERLRRSAFARKLTQDQVR